MFVKRKALLKNTVALFSQLVPYVFFALVRATLRALFEALWKLIEKTIFFSPFLPARLIPIPYLPQLVLLCLVVAALARPGFDFEELYEMQMRQRAFQALMGQGQGQGQVQGAGPTGEVLEVGL